MDASAPAARERFSLSAKVRNEGNGCSAFTTLRYYQSSDSSITSSDTSVGTDSVSSLDASESGDESISLTAPSTPGTYYYGACVDSVSDELDTQNNCSPAVTLTVGAAPAPDLVVDTPTVDASAPAAGERFSLSAKVRNEGNGSSAFTTLRYYQSSDSSITSSDTSVGTDSVSSLDASESGDESISLTAPSTPGTYYFGACVDSLSDEIDAQNNCSAAVTVAVGAAPAPDLVVDTPTVSDSAPDAGVRFTLSATMRNQGNGPSAFTTLRYYRSTESTITTGDTEVGTDSVSRLDASESGNESISLTAPSTPGTYYYGACVDAVSDELDTTNNCSSAVTVTVGAAPPPHLVVDTPTVSESTPAAGARFTLNATVRNQGNGRSDSTTLRYYRSSDSTITTGDTEVGTDYVFRLDASESGDESVSLTASSTPGTYYYGACVDSLADEIDTQNNCSTAVTVTVGATPAPDLVVNTPTVSESSPEAGARITLNATVRNQGNGRSDSTTLRYYQSMDSTITTGDTEVGTDSVFRLGVTASGDEWISLTAPSDPGTYYYGACVDAVSDELDATNNCSSAATVTVGASPAPDLVVNTPTVSDGAPAAGASITLSATVRNQGNGPSAFTTLRYYRSTDSNITGSDSSFGTDSVFSLDASESSDESISLAAPSTPGTYYYGACIDSLSDELDTQNNCSAAVSITVGAAPAPDLVVNTPTVSDGAPAAGARITLSATVCNQGNGSSTFSTLRYYRSTDSTITSGDTLVGADPVSGLNSSGSSDESISLTARSTPGTYYYGACVDSLSDELDTQNNCSASVTVAVGAAPAPDLVVDTPTVSESSPEAGAPITLSATVRNQGSGGAGSTSLRYYRSTDSTITTGDTQLGTVSVIPLGAPGGYTGNIKPTAPSTPGTYYYGACVDAVAGESDTTNNCSVAVTVTVGAAPAPDLVVDTPTVSESSPEAGARITLSATVHNQGSGASGSTTLRYYRSTDSTITTGDTVVGTDPVSGLNSSGTNAESISLTAPTTSGTYYYGACVDSVTEEFDTTNNYSVAVTVTVGAASVPDLVVDTPTVSNSGAIPGATFTLNATVRNQGNGASASTWLHYYLSTDATITSSDTLLSNIYVDGFNPSGSSAKWYNLTAPSTAGSYYYGACVDSVTGESDTTNNCSAAVTVTVGAPDLVVDSPTVSDNSPTAGAGFKLSATVRNQGIVSSGSTILRYYRSADTTITTDDTRVGSYVSGVDSLSPSSTGTYSIDLTAPTTTGTYYYGACVDEVTGESDTTNNCSVAVTVVVGTAPAPDLAVDTPTVSDSSPTAGESITLSATVRNQGSGSSNSTTLRYYRSNDSTVTSGDTEVGTDSVSGLSSSGSSDESISLTAPSTPGTYYYGACVGSVTEESSTTNNCSAAVAITIAAVIVPGSPTGLIATANGETQIDLIWYAPSVSGGASITGYRIEVSTDGMSWSDLVANTDSTSTSYSHTGLTAGTTRHYRVSAINSVGTGTASIAYSTTTPGASKPGAPTSLTATANGQNRIDLSWTAPSDNGGAAITGYRIEVSENGSTWTNLVTKTRNAAISYSHTGLAAGSIRHYRVSAINSAGTGPASNVDMATTDSQSNRAPVAVGTIPDWTSVPDGWEWISMSSYFSDPDNDHLTYSATSSDPAVAISEGAINGRVNIRALELGTATVTITARDPGGLEATQTISVTVKYPNRRPETVGSISTQTIVVSQTIAVDVSPYFRDPDDDLLS